MLSNLINDVGLVEMLKWRASGLAGYHGTSMVQALLYIYDTSLVAVSMDRDTPVIHNIGTVKASKWTLEGELTVHLQPDFNR